MGVLLIRSSPPSGVRQVDADTIRYVDLADTDLSHYLEINLDDSNNLIDFLAKIGDFRFKDADDSDNSDALKFVLDDASGSILQTTSLITDGNILEIDHNGTLNGTSATVDIYHLVSDLAGITINDAATNACTLMGYRFEGSSITATAVGLSTIKGAEITMPSTGAYATETGIDIVADKGDVAQGAKALQISRDLSAAITADRAISNFAVDFSQAAANSSAGDFDLTDAAASGVLKLTYSHTDTTSAAKTDTDLMRGTALLIDIDGTTADAQAKLDMTARAIDITYGLTETSGTLRMGATDIFRITPSIPTGLSSAGAFQFDVAEFNLDSVILNDANITFNALNIDASGLTNTSSADANLINLVCPDDSNIDSALKITADTTTANSTVNIVSSRDINGTVAGAVALTNYSAVLGQAVNHTGGNFIVTQTGSTAGILQLVMAHTTNIGAATTAPDVFASTALSIDIDAEVDGDASADLDAYPRAIDIAYTLTETTGILRWATTDIFRINFDTTGTLSSAAAAAINMMLLDADGITINDSNVSFNAIKVDASSTTLTDASSFQGIEVTIPTVVGQATNRNAGYFNDGTVTTKIVDGSMGISSTGICDEKYYRCEDFDDEAAAVQLQAGLRADEWTDGGLNDAAANCTYIQDQGGVIQIVTNGLDNDSHEITWLGTTVNTGSNPILEFRVMIDAVTANLSGFFVGITETRDIQSINDISAVSDDYFVVGMNSDLATPADIRIWSEDDNGGQNIDQLSGTTIAANTWCTIRMDLTDTEQPRVWINNSGSAISSSHEIAAASITGTIQDNIYVMPVIFVQCLDATPSARTLKVDYVKIWQQRS